MSCLRIVHTLCLRKVYTTFHTVGSSFLKTLGYPRFLCTNVDTLSTKCSLPPSHVFSIRAFEVSTVDCNPADSPEAEVSKIAYTSTNPRLCPGMKHKKHKKKTRRHSWRQKRLEKQNLLDIKDKLKHLAMASGFQGSSFSPAHLSPPDQNDDIIVVYDKQEETKREKEAARLLEANKLCCPVNLQDIPLPPENLLAYKCGNASIALDNIPLPPSPNPYGRKTNNNSAFRNMFEILHQEVKNSKTLIRNFRKWENTTFGNVMQLDTSSSNQASKPNSFTVMSYNVLAQELLEDHRYLYRGNDSRALSWEYRSSILLQEIQEANADVLCLQEVQASHIDTFYNQLEDLGYKGIFKQRTHGKVDGCAIYYKADKFKLIESTTVEYYQNYQENLSILDRDNIAIIARLELQGSTDENQVVVATTHLLYNPRRHDIKLAQTQLLLAELDRMSFVKFHEQTGKLIYHPTILTGDFNLEPNTAVYKLLVEGYLRYSQLSLRSLNVPAHGQTCQESLIPPVLEISSSCQHLSVLQNRAMAMLKEKFGQDKKTDSNIKLYNSDFYKSPQQYLRVQSLHPPLNEENIFLALRNKSVKRGSLCHNLNFLSVYKHYRQSVNSKKMTHEATTRQNDWVTVDYIFYSGTWNEEYKCKQEGPLKLLSRYTLPTRDQCHQLKSLPNIACGSDHLSLIAHFVLMPDEK